MEYTELYINDEKGINAMSAMATEIVREHYDPIIGKEQNDYMLAMFQSVDAIRSQLECGYRYFFVKDGERILGFFAFYPRGDAMYLSKFYLYKNERGKGYSRQMLEYIKSETKKEGLSGIELNVNRGNPSCKIYESLGLKIIRSEKNDIGNGFYMDDYVYRIDFDFA